MAAVLVCACLSVISRLLAVGRMEGCTSRMVWLPSVVSLAARQERLRSDRHSTWAAGQLQLGASLLTFCTRLRVMCNMHPRPPDQCHWGTPVLSLTLSLS